MLTLFVVPAKARTHNYRAQLLRESRQTAFLTNRQHGVWVPAFAGTTPERIVGSSQ